MAKRNPDNDQWRLLIPNEISKAAAMRLTQLTEYEFRISHIEKWEKPKTYNADGRYVRYPILITNPVGALELYSRGYKPIISRRRYSGIKKSKSKLVKKEKIKEKKIVYTPIKRKIRL